MATVRTCANGEPVRPIGNMTEAKPADDQIVPATGEPDGTGADSSGAEAGQERVITLPAPPGRNAERDYRDVGAGFAPER